MYASTTQWIKLTIVAFFWISVAILCYLITYNSLSYFTQTIDHPFILEKSEVGKQYIWRLALYIHVISGILIFIATATQFSRKLLKRFPIIHKVSGYTYFIAILWVLVPTGIFMSFSAKGGLVGAGGFFIQGVYTFVATWIAWQSLKEKDFKKHIRWVIRSYAMILTALSFRILHIALTTIPISYTLNYQLSVWGSTIVNLIFGELLILYINKKRQQKGRRS